MDAQMIPDVSKVEALAEIGEAKNFHAGRMNIAATTASADMAEAQREAEQVVGVNHEMEMNLSAQTDLLVTKAHNEKEVRTEQAKADAAGEIQDAEQQIKVVKENAKANVIRAEIEIETAMKEIEKFRNGGFFFITCIGC